MNNFKNQAGDHFKADVFKGSCDRKMPPFARNFFAKKAQWIKQQQGGFNNNVAVNIEEQDNMYNLHFYAPGLEKDAFSITTKNDLLTVSYNGASTKRNYVYSEYAIDSFERSFRLTDKVLSDQIKAAYTNGILTVSISKDPEKSKPKQNITVD